MTHFTEKLRLKTHVHVLDTPHLSTVIPLIPLIPLMAVIAVMAVIAGATVDPPIRTSTHHFPSLLSMPSLPSPPSISIPLRLLMQISCTPTPPSPPPADMLPCICLFGIESVTGVTGVTGVTSVTGVPSRGPRRVRGVNDPLGVPALRGKDVVVISRVILSAHVAHYVSVLRVCISLAGAPSFHQSCGCTFLCLSVRLLPAPSFVYLSVLRVHLPFSICLSMRVCTMHVCTMRVGVGRGEDLEGTLALVGATMRGRHCMQAGAAPGIVPSRDPLAHAMLPRLPHTPSPLPGCW